MSKASISLSELVTDVKITLQSRYELPIWVVAEISEMNINRSGHCYMELIEKDSDSDRVLAKCRATAWAFTYRTVKAYFESTTSETLRSGLKVLVKVSVEFHEVFGFSLNIQDIDPQYTLGDIARRKLQIIQRLEAEGVLEMNAGVPFPQVPQRIAVISSETAAGFGDFTEQLKTNPKEFVFQVELFQAVMQGERAPESIMAALEQIFNRIDEFDCVAILRGGGSKSDLSCFDDYDLAYFVTQFPLPVITGIGHERDNTVVDLVAHTRLKTPTAIAEFLINAVTEFDERLDEYSSFLQDFLDNYFDNKSYQLEKLSQQLLNDSVDLMQLNTEGLFTLKSNLIQSIDRMQHHKLRRFEKLQSRLIINTGNKLSGEEQLILMRNARLARGVKGYIHSMEHHITALASEVSLVDPQKVLDRGFAYVTHMGELVKNSNQLTSGDSIRIRLANGAIEADVTDNELK